MKLSSFHSVFLFSTLTTSSAFITRPITTPQRFAFSLSSTAAEESTPPSSSTSSTPPSSDFGKTEFATTTTPKAESAYDRIGFQEENVALGIDPTEVLQWLGTREDIVARFLNDNKNMDQEKAEEEVNKFMMDAEMVNKFIAYEKRKADPKYLRKMAEENLNDPSVWALYAAWVGGGIGFGVVKNTIIEPKFASGEWQEIHVNLGDMFHFDGGIFSAIDHAFHSATDAMVNFGDQVAHVVPYDAVQESVEAASVMAQDVATK